MNTTTLAPIKNHAPHTTFDHYEGWTVHDRQMLREIGTLVGLADLAISIMRRRGGPFDLISGPISSGPGGSTEERLIVFEKSVEKLATNTALDVFSQTPFEINIRQFLHRWRRATQASKKDYCHPILEVFYARVFASGLVKRLHFMPRWNLSIGATWEHDVAPEYGIERVYLPDNFTDEIVRDLAELNRLGKV